ncbi:uncharacterized protein LOC134232822 [Saccostrea cucullata]|uniref:uncharacterized protein LOC134232822 n=1 Tax=Saccostrea cuccullata TaxID=36930 RepID=UPI002ED150C2
MQTSLNRFSDACDNFGLTISTKKTEVMFQPAPNLSYTEPNIYIKSERLKPVEKFTYLGCTLSRNVHIDDEVNSRIAKASSAFGRLNKAVWGRRGITTTTKLSVYRAVVLTTLLYACETWTVYSRHTRKLNHFHTVCLRKILGIKWQDRIPDTEVLNRCLALKRDDGANQYQKEMKQLAEQKRTKRKERAASVDTPLGPSCPVCGRTFHAKIGLTSHLRIHKN